MILVIEFIVGAWIGVALGLPAELGWSVTIIVPVYEFCRRVRA